jgi:hypothetical protein
MKTERLSCRMRFCVEFYTEDNVELVQVKGKSKKIKYKKKRKYGLDFDREKIEDRSNLFFTVL